MSQLWKECFNWLKFSCLYLGSFKHSVSWLSMAQIQLGKMYWCSFSRGFAKCSQCICFAWHTSSLHRNTLAQVLPGTWWICLQLNAPIITPGWPICSGSITSLTTPTLTSLSLLYILPRTFRNQKQLSKFQGQMALVFHIPGSSAYTCSWASSSPSWYGFYATTLNKQRSAVF